MGLEPGLAVCLAPVLLYCFPKHMHRGSRAGEWAAAELAKPNWRADRAMLEGAADARDSSYRGDGAA